MRTYALKRYVVRAIWQRWQQREPTRAASEVPVAAAAEPEAAVTAPVATGAIVAALAEEAAEAATAGAEAVLAKTASITCTTPLLARTSVRITLAVTGPEVTNTPNFYQFL